MQSQHLHLQSVDSQQMHPREQRPHPQHLQQQQQHHSYQIHHLQRQHQSRHHQPSQSHHQPHPQSLQQQQQQHLQSSHQQQRQHTQQQTRRQQPNASHPQHHLFPHQSSQLGSLALSTSNTTAAFPVSSTPNHNNPQFTAQALTRDNLQPLQQHQQSHFQAPLSQPTLHHQNPAQNANSFANSVQPIQMQPLLPSQQPNQAAFGNLANISGSMLQAAVVDDNPANPHQFANSQSGDALTPGYPWDSAHSAHGALTSQNLAAANHTNQQQPLLPISLVGDTRGSNNQAFAAQNASGANSFGGALNPNMGVLSSSLNNSMVGGLVNGNSLAPNVGNVAPDLSQRNGFSLGEGPQRPTKILKKASGRAAQQKNVPSRVRNVRGPITSPVSTATLPNMSQPSTVGSNPQLEHAGVPGQNTAMGNMISSSPHAVRQARGIQGGKAKGRMRVPSRGMDTGEMPGPGALSSSNTSVGMVAVAPNQGRDDPAAGSTNVQMPGTLAPQSFGDAKNGASATVAWSTPKKATSRSRSRRKGDGTTTSLPVHLRNPKKGRARVFRECKACRQENHIRRSDCQNCKAPLPAGKRRRDGNPVYDSKRRVPSAAGTVPDSHVSQGVGRGRSGVKDDLVPSVMTK